MKLIHSIPIIITQILFLHLYTALSSTATTITIEQQETTTKPTSEQEDANYFEISEESRKIIIEQAKASLLKVLGLKEVPKTKPKNKATVPYAMFEEYRKLRDSVRETIPDDRDFYGKINLHDLEKRHVDFWNVVYNKYPGYDIEIDMDGDESSEINNHYNGVGGGGKKFLYKGDYEVLSFVKPQSEPEDVPQKFEHTLPPHSNSQKSFISVHLRFNLSQELFTNPISGDELQAAELHLSRERISDNEEENEAYQQSERELFFSRDTSSTKQQTIITDHHPTIREEESLNLSSINHSSIKENDSSIRKESPSPSTTTTQTPTTGTKKRLKKNRYQRLYILHVLGYDEHNEPITRIHDSQVIDTHRSTPLMLDIQLIVKRWIQNPADNYGIIVRITNEDKNYYEQQEVAETTSLDNTTNASKMKQSNAPDNSGQLERAEPLVVAPGQEIMDHVRLKREFRSTSEVDEVWYQKQPSLYIFSSPPEAATRHVKRNTGTTTSGRPSTRPKIAQKKTARPAERCRRKSLQINFDEVGWSSWIIAPNAYNAFYCTGDCSYPMSENATNHAIIQSIFHSVGRVVPKSCCAPTKLSNISILYQLDGAIRLKQYDDMIVESCGCL